MKIEFMELKPPKLVAQTETIKKYIKDNHLTVKTFCQKCHIGVSTYYKILNNKVVVSPKVITKILKATNISVYVGYY